MSKLAVKAEAVNKALDRLQNATNKQVTSVHLFEQKIDKLFEKVMTALEKISSCADKVIIKRREEIQEAQEVLKKYGRQ